MSAVSTITKTIWQYSELLSQETMEFLKGIAPFEISDCGIAPVKV